MARNKPTNLPSSIEDLVQYFDTHDMGEHWEQLPEADFAVAIKKKTHLVAIDGELLHKLSKIANQQQTSAEALLDTWLKEKLNQAN